MKNVFRSVPELNNIFLYFTFQIRNWFIFCVFLYVIIIHLLLRGEGVGIYCKLIPDWIESIWAWISFPTQYKTKFIILLGELFQYTSDSKLLIWVCSQDRIDLNSQSNFYDVLTLDHTSTCPTQSTKQHTYNTFYIQFHQIVHLTVVILKEILKIGVSIFRHIISVILQAILRRWELIFRILSIFN